MPAPLHQGWQLQQITEPKMVGNERTHTSESEGQIDFLGSSCKGWAMSSWQTLPDERRTARSSAAESRRHLVQQSSSLRAFLWAQHLERAILALQKRQSEGHAGPATVPPPQRWRSAVGLPKKKPRRTSEGLLRCCWKAWFAISKRGRPPLG